MKKSRKFLSDEDRLNIYNHLLSVSENGNLPYGAKRSLALRYGVSEKVIYNIWKRREEPGVSEGATTVDVRSRRKGNCGTKKKHESETVPSIEKSDSNDRVTSLPFDTLYNYSVNDGLINPTAQMEHKLSEDSCDLFSKNNL